MVYEREALGLLMRNEPFYRTVEIFLNTGTVDKKMYNVDNLPRKLNDIMQLIILQLVLDRPGILLREIQAEVKEVVGMDFGRINNMSISAYP